MKGLQRVLPPGYGANHKRVYRKRGRADANTCVSCDKQARDWAQLHDTDGTDPVEHYVPMCRSCHFKYDEVGEQSWLNRERKQDPEVVERRSAPIRGIRRADNKSGISGVYRHSQNDSWYVQVHRVNGGSYAKLADAVKARNVLAVQIYGPDAKVYPVPDEKE